MRKFDRQAMLKAAAEVRALHTQGIHSSLCILLEETHQEAMEMMLAATTERELWQAQGAANVLQDIFNKIAPPRRAGGPQ